MKFGTALVESSGLLVQPDADFTHLPSLCEQTSLTSEDNKTHLQNMRKYIGLPPAYEYMAWRYIGHLHEKVQPSAYTIDADRVESSMVGIAIMARFLSFMPYLYSVHRDRFPGRPDKLCKRARELGSIAARSSGFITAIASEAIPICGQLEKDYDLRGSHDLAFFDRLKSIAGKFVLAGTPDNLVACQKSDTKRTIEFYKSEYQREHSQQLLSDRVGCMALKVIAHNGTPVFETMWRSMTHTASTDERFFVNDLGNIQSTLNEYELGDDYLINLSREMYPTIRQEV